MFVADTKTHRICRIDLDYKNHADKRLMDEKDVAIVMVSTVAGGDNEGYADGVADEARFWRPTGLALDSAGDIIVADFTNSAIRKIGRHTWKVTTIAGGPRLQPNDSMEVEYAEASIDTAIFNCPTKVLVDKDNNIVVSDNNNHRIRMICGENVHTIAGMIEDD